MVNHERLVGVLVDFARNLVGDYRVEAILETLCGEVAEIMPVTGAGVMLADERDIMRFVAASDSLVRTIEGLQIELSEGPCLEAYRSGKQVLVADFKANEQFPRFAPRAVAVGLRGVYSFPMRLHGNDERIGALNLYRDEGRDLDDEDQATGQLLADVATSYIVNARAFERTQQLTEQLQHALNTRVVIEQAKGRLAEQLDVDADKAFDQLRRYARQHRVKVHDVAREIVHGRLRLEAS